MFVYFFRTPTHAVSLAQWMSQNPSWSYIYIYTYHSPHATHGHSQCLLTYSCSHWNIHTLNTERTEQTNKNVRSTQRYIDQKPQGCSARTTHTHRLPIICINHEGVCQCVRVRVCYLVCCLFRYRHNSQYPNILLPGRLTHARTPHQKCSINKLNIPCVAHGLWFIFRNAMFQSSRIQTHTHTCAIHSPNIQVQFGINDKCIQFKMLIRSQQ